MSDQPHIVNPKPRYVAVGVTYLVASALFGAFAGIAAVALTLIPTAVAHWRDRERRAEWVSAQRTLAGWGVRRATRRQLVVGAMVGLGLVVLGLVAGVLIWVFLPEAEIVRDGVGSPMSQGLYGSDPLLQVASALLVVVVAPVGEEIAFRGMVGHEFTAGRWSPALIWLTSTLVFTVVHSAHTPLGMGLVFCHGSAYWLLWHRTRSVWPGVVAHGTSNSVAVFLTLLI